MYQCEHFSIQELVPPDLYKEHEEWVLWFQFDDRLLKVLDRLRATYGPMTVNNWSWGGSLTQSGLRTPKSKYYSFTSQHAHGRAVDARPKDCSVETIRKDILELKYEWMADITGLELKVSWLHIDTRNHRDILTFEPA